MKRIKKTQAINFLKKHEMWEVNELMIELDNACIESEQDYGEETTTWIFEDDSAIKINNTDVQYIEDIKEMQ